MADMWVQTKVWNFSKVSEFFKQFCIDKILSFIGKYSCKTKSGGPLNRLVKHTNIKSNKIKILQIITVAAWQFITKTTLNFTVNV